MARISLHWPIDLNGYRIKPAAVGGSSSRAAKTIVGGAASGPLIVRNGGPLNFDRDCMRIDGLYHRLASYPPTESGAHTFVSQYGFLRAARSEPVEFICSQINVVRSLVALKEAKDWEALDLWMIDYRKTIRLNPELLAGDPPQLFFRPASLLDAIYLQFFEDISGSANLGFCGRPGCGEWFKYGPGTGRRNTARYCSPKCQKADAYSKTKEGRS